MAISGDFCTTFVQVTSEEFGDFILRQGLQVLDVDQMEATLWHVWLYKTLLLLTIADFILSDTVLFFVCFCHGSRSVGQLGQQLDHSHYIM